MNAIGAVILAGGKSRRMGKNKAYLSIDGQTNGQTFLSRLLSELKDFEEVLLSVDSAEKYKSENVKAVEDLYGDCGPIGGIYSALRFCRSDYLLALGCDMPLFQKEAAHYMSAFVDTHHDAFVLLTREERAEPLCAIYSKCAADILQAQIKSGNYRLTDALAKMRVKYIPLRHSIFPDTIAQGTNTKEEYSFLLRRSKGVPVVAVCGVKNSGKTTLLTNVIPVLIKRGLRVAAIKHDGHDFESDVPETDSYRLKKSGAFAVGIYSPNRYMLTAEQNGISPDFFFPFFAAADIILLEGGKHSPYPKIEIVRSGISQHPVSDPATLIALCSDLEIYLEGVPVLPLADYQAVADVIDGCAR